MKLNVLLSLLATVALMGQANAQNAVRAAKPAPNAGRISAPAAGAKLGQETLGTVGSARPNLGATNQQVGSQKETLGSGKVSSTLGASCGGDISTAQKIIIDEGAKLNFVPATGRCLSKLQGGNDATPADAAVNGVIAGGNSTIKKLGLADFNSATTEQKIEIYRGAARSLADRLRLDSVSEGVERIKALCNNGCDVTVCDQKALAALN